MYTLRITDDNSVITTEKEKLMEKSNHVNTLQILVNKMYKDQIDMTDTTVLMKYVLPVSKRIKMTQLIANNLNYNDNYIQYIVPITAYITSEPGNIEVSFTFLKIVHDEETDTNTSYIRKTESAIIHITKLAQYDTYEPSELFTEIDQRILALIAAAKDIKSLSQAVYDNIPTDLRLNTESKKLTLINTDGDTGNGVNISDLSDAIAKDLTGVDPDGKQDGVVHVDQVPNVQAFNLDELLN